MSTRSHCQHCGEQVPAVSVLAGSGWDRILEVLANDQRSMAVWEIAARAGCSRDIADLWLVHLEHCVKSWPVSADCITLVQETEDAFSDVSKPEHFTDYTHCDECLEHDETLRRGSRLTISRPNLGRPGWSPIGFCSAPGLMYYFPALVRYSCLPNLFGYEDLPEMVSHAVGPRGKGPEMFALATALQRRAVTSFARWLSASEVPEAGAVLGLWA
jgi:hypothetical protein